MSLQKIFRDHYNNEPFVTGKPTKNILKNRYFRLAVYVGACLTTTLFYVGWQDCQRILYKNKAYEWLCSAEELAERESNAYKCNDTQYSRIQNLYTIAIAAEFSCALLAGILTDTIGPLLTSFLGNTIYLLSWIIILLSNEMFPAYWLGFLLMGASVNLISFPCLEAEEFFPSNRRLALSIIIAAQTGGSMVAPIMNAILEGNPSLTLLSLLTIYLLCIVLPVFILSILCLPVKRIIVMKQLIEDQKAGVYKKENMHINTEKIDIIPQTHDMQLAPTTNYSAYLKKIIKQVNQLNYILFGIYYIISVAAHGYYLSVVDFHFEKQVGEFHGYYFPTQIIWGVLIGYLVDYTGTLIICEVLNLTYIVSILLAFPNYIIPQYVSSVIFIMTNSYLYVVKYTYLSEYYSGDTFQTLVGLMGLFAGLFQLINYILERMPQYFKSFYIVYATAVGFTFCFLILLQFRLKTIVSRYFSKNLSKLDVL